MTRSPTMGVTHGTTARYHLGCRCAVCDIIDDVVVDRLMRGEYVEKPTGREKAEAVARLAGEGFSDPEIAERTGYALRSVGRLRAECGIPAGRPNEASLIPRRRDGDGVRRRVHRVST